MKDKIKEITARSNGMSNEARAKKLRSYIMGWVNYFKVADMKNLLLETDEWMRRNLALMAKRSHIL